MGTARTIVEIHHDTGYGEAFVDYLNIALRGRDMIAERVVSDPVCESGLAIKALYSAGKVAFITCESGPLSSPQVVAKFQSSEDAQEFHRALIQCGSVARMLDEAKTKPNSSR